MKAFITVTCVTLLSWPADYVFAISPQDAVKRSRSGICHPPESPYYDRVIATNTAILTLEECLKTGRLPEVLQPLWNAVLLENGARKDGDVAGIEAAQEMRAAAAKEVDKERDGFKDFGGLRFGFGIGMTFLGSQIDEVRIIDGKVAVTKERSNQGRVILESHKFIWGLADPNKKRLTDNWAFGPFVAATLADDQGQGLLTAYGAGLIAGYRTEKSSHSWNIGVGWFVDTDVTALRPGIVDGMETTLMDSNDVIKTVDEEGLIVLISGSW